MSTTHGFGEALGARQVFGEPVRHGRLTVLPVAKIAGGGGGDAGGEGFGGAAKPVGAFVIREGGVSWRPAVEPAVVLAVVGLGVAAALLVARRRRREQYHE